MHLKRILTAFINGVTQPLTRILRRHGIQVVNKPLKTLQQEFPSPKFRPSIERQPNVVYKIPCADCDWCYVDKTGRCFESRKKEHIRNVITCANGSNIAKHAWSFDHRIDFDNSSVIILKKALFALEKLWRLCTPLLPSMLTITLSQSQTSTVFFLNNSQLFHSFILCFVFPIVFILPFLHIFYTFTFNFQYPSKAVERQPKAQKLLFKIFSQRTFLRF